MDLRVLSSTQNDKGNYVIYINANGYKHTLEIAQGKAGGEEVIVICMDKFLLYAREPEFDVGLEVYDDGEEE